jgi:beta-lactam-binding protein with PASTA domain
MTRGRVFISTGPASTTPLHVTKVTMPSVVGDSVAQAERELTKAGIRSIAFKYSVVTPGKTVRTGTVVAQSPAAGADMPSGKTPTLWIRP